MKIKLLDARAKLPTKGSEYSAGWDLYADSEFRIEIPPQATHKINTGIAVEIPEGYFGAIFARSGLATKNGLRPANCVGVIDSDYRGPIMVAMYNDTDYWQDVEPGSRIAQLVVIPYLPVELEVVDELEETDRGENGFGSTGMK